MNKFIFVRYSNHIAFRVFSNIVFSFSEAKNLSIAPLRLTFLTKLKGKRTTLKFGKLCGLSIIVLMILSACGGGKKAIAKNKDNHIVNKYAEILQAAKSSIKNIKLYTFIDDWYGTKYRYGGLSKSGVDCSGFCNVLYKQVYNKKIQRTTSELSKKINKTSKNNLREGDFVFFNISREKNSHIGIYLKNNRFVHASSSKGVVISSLENPYYKKAYSKGGGLR